MGHAYHPLFPLGPDLTPCRKLSGDRVRVEHALGADMLVVDREAIRLLSEQALVDVNHLLRPGHLAQLAGILDDPEATSNAKFVAFDLLKKANIAAGGVLPICQDTGAAIVVAKKGRLVWTDGDDEAAIPQGVGDAYERKNLRYSQLAALSMFEEKNTGHNLAAQIEIHAEGEDAYNFLSIAKGGGSANQSLFYQATPSILTHDRMIAFLKEKIFTLGAAACPPLPSGPCHGGVSVSVCGNEGDSNGCHRRVSM
jgi:fumarate hydratase class I